MTPSQQQMKTLYLIKDLSERLKQKKYDINGQGMTVTNLQKTCHWSTKRKHIGKRIYIYYHPGALENNQADERFSGHMIHLLKKLRLSQL